MFVCLSVVAFYQLRRITSCGRALPIEAAKTIVNSFGFSRADCCNALSADSTLSTINTLQRILNAMAKVIDRGNRYDQVTLLIRNQLHWLLIQKKIIYKLSANI